MFNSRRGFALHQCLLVIGCLLILAMALSLHPSSPLHSALFMQRSGVGGLIVIALGLAARPACYDAPPAQNRPTQSTPHTHQSTPHPTVRRSSQEKKSA
jgi:hypothetical protein